MLRPTRQWSQLYQRIDREAVTPDPDVIPFPVLIWADTTVFPAEFCGGPHDGETAWIPGEHVQDGRITINTNEAGVVRTVMCAVQRYGPKSKVRAVVDRPWFIPDSQAEGFWRQALVGLWRLLSQHHDVAAWTPPPGTRVYLTIAGGAEPLDRNVRVCMWIEGPVKIVWPHTSQH